MSLSDSDMCVIYQIFRLIVQFDTPDMIFLILFETNLNHASGEGEIGIHTDFIGDQFLPQIDRTETAESMNRSSFVHRKV